MKSITIAVTMWLVALTCKAESWSERRSQFSNVLSVGEFRVFYDLSGRDALPEKYKRDKNNNGHPDFIDGVMYRLISANKQYTKTIGLTPPLKRPRYAGYASFVDVNVMTLAKNTNGTAYDGVSELKRAAALSASKPALIIDLSKFVRLRTQTVEHELFHLYQNGYTRFKNRWFTEGTARWAEQFTQGRISSEQYIPSTHNEKQELFSSGYEAHSFWNGLIKKTSNDALGFHFIQNLFERLSVVDDQAAKDRGISNYNWPEAEQKSTKNNKYIWAAALKSTTAVANRHERHIATQFP